MVLGYIARLPAAKMIQDTATISYIDVREAITSAAQDRRDSRTGTLCFNFTVRQNMYDEKYNDPLPPL